MDERDLSAAELWAGRVPVTAAPEHASRLVRLATRAARTNGWLLYGAMVLLLCWFAAELVLAVLFAGGALHL